MRLAAPMIVPPATTSLRSWPSGGIRSWTSAPLWRNHGRRASRWSARSRSSRFSQSTTSLPQLPKRGLSTAGKSRSGGSACSSISVVRGCGSPARRSVRAVRSLSCAHKRALGRLSRTTPASASRSSDGSPSSTPSRSWRTSSLTSARSPGPSSSSASRGVSSSARVPFQQRAASARLVAFEPWPMIATRTPELSLKGANPGKRSGYGPVTKWRVSAVFGQIAPTKIALDEWAVTSRNRRPPAW